MGKKSLLKSTAKNKKASPKPDTGQQAVSSTPESKPDPEKSVKKERPARETGKKSSRKTTSAKASSETKPPVTQKQTAATLKSIKTTTTSTSSIQVDETTTRMSPTVKTPKHDDAPRKTKPEAPVLRPLPRAFSQERDRISATGKQSVFPRPVLAAVFAVGFLYLLLIHASAVNQQRFFIQPGDASIKLYQGSFSPAGRRLVFEIPGMEAPQPVKRFYTKEEVFPLIHGHSTKVSVGRLKDTPLPDWSEVRSGLQTTSAYAVTEEQKILVQQQGDNLMFIRLLHKSDVAAGAGEWKLARSYLCRAVKFAPGVEEILLVKNKISAIDTRIGKPASPKK